MRGAPRHPVLHRYSLWTWVAGCRARLRSKLSPSSPRGIKAIGYKGTSPVEVSIEPRALADPHVVGLGPFIISSSSVKTSSLLHIADTFPYKLLSDVPAPLFHPGPLNPAAWERLLSTHPDRLYAHTIVQIIRYGARIGCTGPDQLNLRPNLPSANDFIENLNKDPQDQKSQHRLMPTSDPGNRFISSPLGLVPKSEGTNAWP